MPSQLKQTRMPDSVMKDNIIDQWSRSKTPRRKLEIYWNKAINDAFFPGKESNISSEIMANNSNENVKDDEKCILKKLDTRYFLPENIEVKINQNREVVVNAIRTEINTNDTDSFSRWTFTEIFKVPNQINLNNLSATINKDGDLFILTSSDLVRQTKDQQNPKDLFGERTLEVDFRNKSLTALDNDSRTESTESSASKKIKRCQAQQNVNFVRWNDVFENFFLPMIRSYAYPNEYLKVNESKSKKAQVSNEMRNFVVEKLNQESTRFLNDLIHSESKTSKTAINEWDRRFNDFFNPIFNYEEFVKLK